MAATWFGDSRKWLIVKRLGQWAVCPPSTAAVARTTKGGLFNSGAEAFAAYAAGDRRPVMRCDCSPYPNFGPNATPCNCGESTSPVEPYHGKAAVTQ